MLCEGRKYGREKGTRSPQQKRSIDKRDKILEAAYTLFCSSGYYKTTTPEVAKSAGVSIGSLYSYFEDKNDLFMAVLERYEGRFDALRSEALQRLGAKDIPLRDSLRSLILDLVAIHEESKALNDEMKMLYRNDPAIAAHMDAREEKISAAILESFRANADRMRLKDPEAAALVVGDIIDATVDRVVFGRTSVKAARVVDAAVEALSSFLIE